MRIVLAESYGMCFGVRDAVAAALDAPYRRELTVLGELVHNPEVLRRLSAAGVRTAPSTDSQVETRHVMITAHGAAPSVIERLAGSGLEVHEATCPLVAHAHRMLDRLVAQGYFPVVIGDPGHVEVRGLVGDLLDYAVVSAVEDLDGLPRGRHLGVISQTTQPLERVLDLVALIRDRFPETEVRFVDTVCQPTKERQLAARSLAAECDVVVVVGGAGSNNTRQLAATCAAGGAQTYQISGPGELEPGWFTEAQVVGLTGGTSTLQETMDAVRARLEEIAAGLPYSPESRPS